MQTKISAEQARSLQRNNQLERTPQRRQQAKETVAAPTAVGLLYGDNLVPIEMLEYGVAVQVPAWPRVLAGDKLVLQFNEANVATYEVLDPSQVVFPYEMLLSPAYLLSNGIYSLSYTVTPESIGLWESEATDITVDHTPPNLGNIPAPPEFPAEVVADGITTDYLNANGDKVIIKVPGYAKMEADQKVHLIWANSHPLPVQALGQADVDQGYLEVEIPGDLIRATGEGRFTAYYYLTSRAGLDGPRSLDSTVDVLLTAPPSGLRAPVVPLAADGLIDLDDVNTGVTVEIPPYQNLAFGDLVSAKWGNSALAPYPMPLGGLPAEIPVPRATVIAEGSGSVVVSYHIQRNAHPFPEAPSTRVTVDVDVVGPLDPDPTTPENEALLAPTVFGGGAIQSNELLPADRDLPASVTVPFFAEAQAGQIITVHWGYRTRATALQPHPITDNDVANQRFPDFRVPVDIVNATPNDAAWPVYYTLSRADGKNPVLSVTQAVNVHMVGPGGSGGLDAATFPDVNGVGWLLLDAVSPDGARVTVAAYEHMQAGDKVTLNWVACSTTNGATGTEIEGSDYSDSIVVKPEDVGSDLSFVVPFDPYVQLIATVVPSAQGAGKVSYTVSQNGEFTAPKAVVPIDLYPLD